MSFWTQERVDFLLKNVKEGKTNGEIARLMHVKRGVVIGKVHRLGLNGKTPKPRAPRLDRDRSKEAKPKSNVISLPGHNVRKRMPPNSFTPKVVNMVEPLPLRIHVLKLSDKTCKWPIGHPGMKDFGFCGHKPRDAAPYCEYHARLAYQSVEERRQEVREAQRAIA